MLSFSQSVRQTLNQPFYLCGTFISSQTFPLTHSLTLSPLTHTLTITHTSQLTHLLTHSCTYSFTHLLISSLSHVLPNSLTRPLAHHPPRFYQLASRVFVSNPEAILDKSASGNGRQSGSKLRLDRAVFGVMPTDRTKAEPMTFAQHKRCVDIRTNIP